MGWAFIPPPCPSPTLSHTPQVHFGNHFALEGKSRKKSEICAAIGAQVLIDDNPTYAKECAEVGGWTDWEVLWVLVSE